MQRTLARDLWHALEPIHAAVYFADEAKQIYADVGLKGYWMGYFASRSAAFGAAQPEVVLATFYNFPEHMVRRAIPDAWTFSSPERVLRARLRVADIVIRKMMDVERAEVIEAADLAEAAARAARLQGRALFAAHASLAWPTEPHMRLWHAATLLREHRGDTHVALLVANDLDGIEAHVLAAAAGKVDPAWQKQTRGLTDDDWTAAAERLRARGLLDETAAFTEAGRALKQDIEDRTDDLSLQPYEAIGEQGCARLIELISLLVQGDPVPHPNPMGLTR